MALLILDFSWGLMHILMQPIMHIRERPFVFLFYSAQFMLICTGLLCNIFVFVDSKLLPRHDLYRARSMSIRRYAYVSWEMNLVLASSRNM